MAANPFDIADEVWSNLSPEHKDILGRLDAYDLSWLVGKHARRFGARVSRKRQSTAVQELKKFLAIKILYDPHPLVMPSALIGAMWHTFILHTAEYEAFSHLFYGKLIHHVPGGGTGQGEQAWFALYRSLFGDFPDVWSMSRSGVLRPGFRDITTTGVFSDGNDMDSDDGAFP